MSDDRFDITSARDWLGRTLGTSGWVPLDQATVDAYAALTGDRDWLHNDPERARRDSPFGGRTIVQGSLLLAHCVPLLEQVAPASDDGYALNYGFERVRFVRPVPVGSRIRATYVLRDVRERPAPHGGTRQVLVMEVVIEADDAPGPAVVAQWLGLVHRPSS